MRIAALLLVLCSCETGKLPLWTGEVDVAAMEREAISICGAGALTNDGALRVTRAPYLQNTTTTTTTVVWGSSDGRGSVVVRNPKGEHVITVPAHYAGDA